MARSKKQQLNRLSKPGVWLVIVLLISLFSACDSSITDTNIDIPEQKWVYTNRVKASFEIKDNQPAYNIYFKLRHTAEYKYANIFVLVRLKEGQSVVTRRYQYKLAKNDGEWLGSGSGSLFSYVLPVLTKHHFAVAGKYEIEVEQNMRDNPLSGIADAGIWVEVAK